MNKRDRQNFLLDAVRQGRVTSQADLVSNLKRAGFEVTQASVSRDLDELGIEKVNGVYTRRRFERDLGNVTFETAAGCLVVGHCMSGLASAVTVRIDRESLPGVVGTIAGDDTIFIAVKDFKAVEPVMQ